MNTRQSPRLPAAGAVDPRQPAPIGPHFLSIRDIEAGALEACLDLAAALKRDRPLGRRAPTSNALNGAQVALVFEKPSLRTRATFEVAVNELGGDPIVLPNDALAGRETLPDVARNLERWVDAVVVRTFAQGRLLELAGASSRLHIVNALSDEEHPCQALADYLTLREHRGRLAGLRLAYVGDGNNVATSLVQAGLLLGVSVHVASPAGYDLPEPVLGEARARARHGATVRLFGDAREAVAGADAVYTDVWASMGREAETAAREAVFGPYQVNASLMEAAPGALFMHCLPAHRGAEATAEVLDGPASVVFDQAENRLHTQKALLHLLVAGGRKC
jgi:ornithine carbamoyltransferase